MTSTPPPPATPAAEPSGEWPPPPLPSPGTGDQRPPLRRSRSDKVLGGVAGGLAEYTGVDALLWRVGAIALTLAGGSGVIIYVLLWLLMPAAPVGQAAATAPAGPPAPRGPRSPVPRVTLAALLIVLGAGVLLNQFTDWDLGPRSFFGSALLVVGVGLVVSAVTGVGRGAKGGLIGLGVVLSVATLVTSTVDFDDGPGRSGGIGDRSYRPVTADAVRSVYEGGVGDLEIDLTGIDPATLDGRPVRFEVRHGVGDVDVRVPQDADVWVAGQGGIGHVEFEDETIPEDGTLYGGVGTGDWVDDGRAEFRIEIHNGIGDVEVSRG